MVLNEKKRARLAEVLALRQDAAAGAGASAPSAPPTNQVVPSPTPLAPIVAIPLAIVRASPTSAPLEKGKRVVEITSDDEDTMEGPCFKRRKAAVVVTSHSSFARCPASFRDHPPSASSPQGLPALWAVVKASLNLFLPPIFPWSFNRSLRASRGVLLMA